MDQLFSDVVNWEYWEMKRSTWVSRCDPADVGDFGPCLSIVTLVMCCIILIYVAIQHVLRAPNISCARCQFPSGISDFKHPSLHIFLLSLFSVSKENIRLLKLLKLSDVLPASVNSSL